MGTATRPVAQELHGGATDAPRWATSPLGPLVVFAVLRLPVILSASAPVIVPDESGSWAVGRWLSGMQPLIEMNDMPEYPLVPGAVLAPLNWLPVDPATRYRLGLAACSLLVVVAGFLLRGAVRVATGDRVLAAAALAVTLLFPATFLTTLFTWAEATVLLCVAAFVRGVVGCLHAPGRAARSALLVAAVAAGVAPTVHGRLLVLPAVWLALLGWVALGRRARTPLDGVPRAELGAAAGVTVLVALSLHQLDRAAKQAVWSDPRSAEDAVVSGLLDPARWPDVLQAAVGQFWYAAAASAGLAVLGAVAALRVMRRGSDAAARTLCAVLAASGAGVAVISAAFMSRTVGNIGGDQVGRMGGIRWDHLVYGRYLDTMVLLAAVGGVAALAVWPAARSRRVLGGAAVASLAAAVLLGSWWHDAELAGSIQPTTAGLAVVADLRGGLPPVRVTLLAVLAMAVLALVAGMGRGALFAAAAVLLCLGALSAAGIAADLHGPGASVAIHRDLPDAPADAAEVVIPSDLNDRMPYVLVWPRMQVMAVPLGWHFDFAEADAAALAGNPPGDAGLVVLPGALGPPGGPGEWERQWSNDDVTLWARVAAD